MLRWLAASAVLAFVSLALTQEPVRVPPVRTEKQPLFPIPHDYRPNVIMPMGVPKPAAVPVISTWIYDEPRPSKIRHGVKNSHCSAWRTDLIGRKVNMSKQEKYEAQWGVWK